MQLKNKNIRKSVKNLAFEEPKGTLVKTLLFFSLIMSLINYGLIYLVRTLGYQMDINIYNDLINIFAFIIISPLFLNFINMFLNNSKDELITFSDLFKIKKYSFKFMWYFTLTILGYYLINLIFSLIPIIGFVINIILFIILIPVLFIMPYVYLENKELSFKEIIENSFKLISGNRTIFYGTLLSFTPWFILGLFTLGILYLWLVPYIYITLTYLYLNFKEEKKFEKINSLSNQAIIVLFIIGFIILNIFSFIVYPDSFNEFKDNIGLSVFKNQETLSYGNTKIKYTVPEDYELASETKSIKTYVNDDKVLQYTIYLSTVEKVFQMDKKIVDDYKKSDDYQKVTDMNLTLKVKNKNLKGYVYTLTKENEKLHTMVVYYPKDVFVVTITLTSKNKISEEDMEKLIKVN